MLSLLRSASDHPRLPVFVVFLAALFGFSGQVHSQCSNPANAIVAENCLPGNPASEWDIGEGSIGDPTIQGFTTDISVNQGGTVFFKISTPASAYTINIYRMGYYGGMGARKIATITPSVHLPQIQSACLSDTSVGLTDCGNWQVSASWQVPANATSGIYFAHLIYRKKRLKPFKHPVPDLRRNLAGLQLLWQRKPLQPGNTGLRPCGPLLQSKL